MKLSDCHISRCCLVGAISTALISFGIPAYGIPISSNSSFGALNVASGVVVFNTDFTDLTNGGTYSINGVMQSGLAREVTLPADSGAIANHVPHNMANVFVYDFSSINLGPGVTVTGLGAAGLILLASGSANVGATF